MEAHIINFTHQLITVVEAASPRFWYGAGTVVAALPLTAVVVEWYKRHHYKVNAIELTNHAIDLVVAVTATLMTVATYVITFGPHFAQFFPYLTTVMPTITAFAPHVYDVSKALHSWFVNRQNEDQQARVKAALQTAANATNAQTAPAPPTQPRPSADLLQL